MTKTILIIVAIAVVVGLAILGVRLLSGEDNWICQDGEWVKHGNPSAAKPTEGCEPDIVIVSPTIGEEVSSPIRVLGKAKGPKDIVNFRLKEKDGKILVEDFVTLMTGGDAYADFEKDLVYSRPEQGEGILEVFRKSDFGGKEKNKVVIAIKFKEAETMTVKVFFSNSIFDPEVLDCQKNFAVERTIPKTLAVARAALEQLLAGPTDAEKAEGYFTSINPGVKIQSLVVANGVANVDFDEQLEFQVGGSCRVTAIASQIRETLKQFSTVKDVVISISGRTEDILQP